MSEHMKSQISALKQERAELQSEIERLKAVITSLTESASDTAAEMGKNGFRAGLSTAIEICGTVKFMREVPHCDPELILDAARNAIIKELTAGLNVMRGRLQ